MFEEELLKISLREQPSLVQRGKQQQMLKFVLTHLRGYDVGSRILDGRPKMDFLARRMCCGGPA